MSDIIGILVFVCFLMLLVLIGFGMFWRNQYENSNLPPEEVDRRREAARRKKHEEVEK